MEAIITTYLEEDTGEVVFSSIPDTYQNLQLRLSCHSRRSAGDSTFIRFGTGGGSPDSGSNYNFHYVTASGTSKGGAAYNNYSYIDLGDIASMDRPESEYALCVINILDYANTNKFTSIIGVAAAGSVLGSGASRIYGRTGMWENTAAVDRIRIYNYAANFARGSTMTLYGMRSAN